MSPKKRRSNVAASLSDGTLSVSSQTLLDTLPNEVRQMIIKHTFNLIIHEELKLCKKRSCAWKADYNRLRMTRMKWRDKSSQQLDATEEAVKARSKPSREFRRAIIHVINTFGEGECERPLLAVLETFGSEISVREREERERRELLEGSPFYVEIHPNPWNAILMSETMYSIGTSQLRRQQGKSEMHPPAQRFMAAADWTVHSARH